MRLVWGGVVLVVLGAHFPGWTVLLLWAAAAAPLLALVAHLRERAVRW